MKCVPTMDNFVCKNNTTILGVMRKYWKYLVQRPLFIGKLLQWAGILSQTVKQLPASLRGGRKISLKMAVKQRGLFMEELFYRCSKLPQPTCPFGGS